MNFTSITAKKNDDDSKKLYYPDKCQFCIKALNLPLNGFTISLLLFFFIFMQGHYVYQ